MDKNYQKITSVSKRMDYQIRKSGRSRGISLAEGEKKIGGRKQVRSDSGLTDLVNMNAQSTK